MLKLNFNLPAVFEVCLILTMTTNTKIVNVKLESKIIPKNTFKVLLHTYIIFAIIQIIEELQQIINMYHQLIIPDYFL